MKTASRDSATLKSLRNENIAPEDPIYKKSILAISNNVNANIHPESLLIATYERNTESRHLKNDI